MRLHRERFLAAAIAIGATASACNMLSDSTQAAQVSPEQPGAAAPGAPQSPAAAEEGAGEPIARDHATDVAPGKGVPGIPTSALRSGSSLKDSPAKEAGFAPTKEAGIAPTKEAGISPTKEYGTKPVSPTNEFAAKKPAPTAEK
jgi:hypothetical protein